MRCICEIIKKMVLVTVCAMARAIGLRRSVNYVPRPQKGHMKGKYPIVRTKQYLEQGIVLRNCVKIMVIHYRDSMSYESHQGTRDIVEQHFNQLQYKNPDVQILCVKDLMPTPFLTFFLDDGERVHVDVEGKSRLEILEHVQKIIGKPKEVIAMEIKAKEKNPANFGEGYARKCICEVDGQVPCTATDELLPYDKRQKITGKGKRNMNPKQYPFGIDED